MARNKRKQKENCPAGNSSEKKKNYIFEQRKEITWYNGQRKQDEVNMNKLTALNTGEEKCSTVGRETGVE